MVIDLRNSFQSMQWNPLTYPYQMFHRSFKLEKEVKVHPPGDNPKNHNLIIQRDFDFNGKCVLCGADSDEPLCEECKELYMEG